MGAIASASNDAESIGLAQANAEGNVVGIARLLFTKYVFAFEVTSALLITAALGAMVLAHKERARRKLTQPEMARDRFAERPPVPAPGPGRVRRPRLHRQAPALLPDGSPSPRDSVGRGRDCPTTTPGDGRDESRHTGMSAET